MNDRNFSAVENRLVIDDLLDVLYERERATVKMCYFEELGQKEIGKGSACARCTSPAF
jgi:DNA-directed RNA polymerase specialized sigma subunit